MVSAWQAGAQRLGGLRGGHRGSVGEGSGGEESRSGSRSGSLNKGSFLGKLHFVLKMHCKRDEEYEDYEDRI